MDEEERTKTILDLIKSRGITPSDKQMTKAEIIMILSLTKMTIKIDSYEDAIELYKLCPGLDYIKLTDIPEEEPTYIWANRSDQGDPRSNYQPMYKRLREDYEYITRLNSITRLDSIDISKLLNAYDYYAEYFI